jgi:peptidyl-prolyl cis-trans isomerase D
MTMLDRMRRHKGWLKWSLALVVLAFVVFYIPDFLQDNAGAAPGQRVAVVEGRAITVSEFQRVYNAQLNAYRNAYGGNVNEQLLRQLGIDRQILQQLIDERAALAEAERLGIRASNAEVRERILRIPAFQEDGQFIGEAAYRQLLRMQRPPVTHTEFEESVRRSIVLEKLQSALTDWISVTGTEIEQEFRRRNEQVRLQLVSFPMERFREEIDVTDAELQEQFDANTEQFRVGEKRKIRYVTIDVQKMRERVNVSDAEVERYYHNNIDQYSTPDQVRARHILLQTEGKDDAEVRAQAEKLLAEARGGADFAELARKHSEDAGSREQGGDLDFFGRGRMVPAFEEAAFTLEPGTIGDLVRTEYGYHILKVEERRPGTTRELAEVRDQIAEQLKWERAQDQARLVAQRVAAETDRPADLDRAAQAHGLTVQESGFFLRDEAIPGVGPSPEASSEAFALDVGQVSEEVRTGQGFVVLGVTDRQDARLPTLDEARDRVREAVIRRKALDAAREQAASVAAQARGGAEFAAAAKKAGVDVQTTELVTRGTALPEVGASTAVDAAAFALPQGGVSDAIVTDNGAAVVRVVERVEPVEGELAQAASSIRSELLNQRRNQFFSAYMLKAKQRMRIEIDRETLQRLQA